MVALKVERALTKTLWGPESNLNRIDAPYTGYHHHSFHGLWDPEIK
jgi:hypothetical protein